MFAIGARIYMKPLLPGELSVGLDMGKIMEAGKRSLLRRLKGKLLQQTVFSPQAKAMLANAVKVKVKQSSLQVVSDHPGFLPLLRGQDRMQMKWLTKARAPIPIVLDDGRLIFRTATPASMARGSWWHPGRAPTDYVDKAKALTRDFMREKILKEVERNMALRLKMAAAGGTRPLKSR
jgi:hypothetical protein